ncbi:hypothetical protein NA57DRAFT_74325 [Rhizodiscina lignyota]|uniref:Survival motor neuron Tudor domain-containing protein n=1 Tax=Rhizodiscina lignyota TaxID=1504668 RepID=A0A9P4ILP5_9PEZI|nr:hypothetical protein NA57DRAFT_74325 [Rhizodiscina lignyota]
MPPTKNPWNDQELVDSWDAALAEYEKYHSIAARGEDPEEVLRNFVNGTDPASAFGTVSVADRNMVLGNASTANSSNDMAEGKYEKKEEEEDEKVDEGESERVDASETPVNGVTEGNADAGVEGLTNTVPTNETAAAQGPAGPTNGAPVDLPAELLGGDQDPVLRNLMLSWYYTGYYAGLLNARQSQMRSSKRNLETAVDETMAEPLKNEELSGGEDLSWAIKGEDETDEDMDGITEEGEVMDEAQDA